MTPRRSVDLQVYAAARFVEARSAGDAAMACPVFEKRAGGG
jgi:hypothetical protein